MPFYTEAITLTENVFLLLRDLIFERTGVYFGAEKREILADKLAPLVLERGMRSFLDYYYLLRYDPSAADEWDRVVDAISVPETYFWREVDQLQVLVNELLPQVIAGQPREPIRIWSAACATGEEPLTLAMLLNEAGWFERAAIEIVGSDVSPRALTIARQGVYRERSFRSLPPHLRSRYFELQDGRWRVDPALHRRVTWARVNLVDDNAVAQYAAAPFILCRNVFIYFAEDAVRRTVAQMYAHMPSPAYLFVGAAESLLKYQTRFRLQQIGGTFVYVKNAAESGNSFAFNPGARVTTPCD
ncbi:MAG: protein-glutamate O-methyltransferase CheR [Anaerolineae bacterium]